jgi:two-component system response regulator VanR
VVYLAQETILIIDDEKEIRDLIGIYLTNEGYNVIKAADGVEGLEYLENENVHLVVLDIMMPRMDGIQACMKIRESRNVPIIMLSAKSQDMDKIMGLTTGADDYITKPFQPLELVARIKSQLRRYLRLNQMDGNPQISTNLNMDVLTIDELVINVTTHDVTVEGREIKLTPREFAILELLARNPGVVFSTEKIYERVWNEPFYESENTVMVHIRNLREKLENNPRTPQYIKTVWGVGYKIEQ